MFGLVACGPSYVEGATVTVKGIMEKLLIEKIMTECSGGAADEDQGGHSGPVAIVEEYPSDIGSTLSIDDLRLLVTC